jgi:hypothetical protein
MKCHHAAARADVQGGEIIDSPFRIMTISKFLFK